MSLNNLRNKSFLLAMIFLTVVSASSNSTATVEDKCNSSESESYINYMAFHYCTLASAGWLSITIMVIWLLFLFYIIAGTTDDFLVPALTVGVDELRISPNVAGSTVLAFANGAPDLFTSIASFSGEGGNKDLGLSSILGGGLFITAFTLGTVVIVSGGFRSSRRPLIRDMVAYAAALFLLLWIYADDKITVLESIIFLVMYALYVLTVVVGSFVYSRYLQKTDDVTTPKEAAAIVVVNTTTTAKEKTSTLPSPMTPSNTSVFPSSDYGPHCTPVRKQPVSTMKDLECQSDIISRPSNDVSSSAIRDGSSTPSSCREYQEEMRKSITSLLRKSENNNASEVTSSETVLQSLRDFMTWDEKNAFGKVLAILELPFTLARRLTIARVEPETWNRYYAVLSWFCAPVFATLVTSSPSTTVLLAICAFGVVAACVSYLTTTSEVPTERRVLLLYVLVAFVLSSIWAYVIANEIVSVMQAIGLGLGISPSILGVTVLAFGNSIGDLVSNMSLAKSGHAKMAAAECFGGPMFNLMVGGGISFLLGSTRAYPEPMTFTSTSGSKDPVVAYGFIFLIISLISTCIYVPLSQFHFTKPYGFFLCGLYFVFLVFAVLSQSNILPLIF